MKQKISSKICKRNMKLFPLYKAISSDFLFFYTINFLFLTQIKHISASAVILEDSFYALFVVLLQIPASLIVDLIGRKKGMMLGNFSNIIYMITVILSKNLFHLIIAESFCAFAFSLKDVADLSLINESIPETTKKSTIFAKILTKGSSRHFVLNSISLIISGFLFMINGYLPIIISLIITILSFLLSCLFIEPLEEESTNKSSDENNKKLAIENLKFSIQNFISSFKFILSSKRLKSLILFSSIMSGLISILANMQVGILEETNISSFAIGIIFAILEIIASVSLKKQEQFHNKFKNKSLSVLGITISFSCILAGSSRHIFSNIYITITIIFISLAIKYIIVGIYYILIDKYYRNFTNSDIDSKIFSAKAFFNSISNVIFGLVASFLMDKTTTQNSFIFIGLIFLVLFTFSSIYMKKRLGLRANEYSKDEVKFSDIPVKN